MSKKSYQTKVSELTNIQRSHLAWRLDHKTFCGYVTAGNIARGNGEYGEATLFEIFKSFDLTDAAAKIQSKKVVDFKIKLP